MPVSAPSCRFLRFWLISFGSHNLCKIINRDLFAQNANRRKTNIEKVHMSEEKKINEQEKPQIVYATSRGQK